MRSFPPPRGPPLDPDCPDCSAAAASFSNRASGAVRRSPRRAPATAFVGALHLSRDLGACRLQHADQLVAEIAGRDRALLHELEMEALLGELVAELLPRSRAQG